MIRTGYRPMTAEEWDCGTDHKAMHSALLEIRTTRKWYCYALACVRLIWDEIPERLRPVIEVTERYVERRASNSDRARARVLCKPPSTVEWVIDPGSEAEWAVYWASAAPTDIGNASVPSYVRQVMIASRGEEAGKIADRRFADLLREIFPNPSRQAKIEPGWLRWSDGAVRRVAETINDEGDFSRVPILADALEEAGCMDDVILGHLRNGQPHVRGCWVVDLVLKKK
jgi:hypothetical protein